MARRNRETDAAAEEQPVSAVVDAKPWWHCQPPTVEEYDASPSVADVDGQAGALEADRWRCECGQLWHLQRDQATWWPAQLWPPPTSETPAEESS